MQVANSLYEDPGDRRTRLKSALLLGAIYIKREDLINDQLPTAPALNCKLRLAHPAAKKKKKKRLADVGRPI